MSTVDSRPKALVTGAARGIGQASAVALLKRGFDVVLVDKQADVLEETAHLLSDLGKVLPLVCNVADFGLVQKLGAQAIRDWGPMDVLVNNAGAPSPKRLLDISEAEWDDAIAVNLKGCFNWCKALAPAMYEGRGGRIVIISSVSAQTGAGPTAVSKIAYCAAKAGLLGMTRGLARELAPKVLVNAICPGITDTAQTRDRIAAQYDRIVQQVPLGRLGTPEDIAEVVAFLAGAEPMFINGEIIDVDGGQYIN
jgi:3-oxoacyl-[acyl-carrier protein] reductase